MVKQAIDLTGGDIQIGVGILIRASLDVEFSNITGHYFDKNIGQFSSLRPNALV